MGRLSDCFLSRVPPRDVYNHRKDRRPPAQHTPQTTRRSGPRPRSWPSTPAQCFLYRTRAVLSIRSHIAACQSARWTTDRRAVCGRSARTVRRGSAG